VAILVTGEALIDFFPVQCGDKAGFIPIPGGSPCNVAVGLGRLGIPVAFLTRISRDQFGGILKTHLEESHVDLTYLSRANQQSAISFVQVDNGKNGPGFGFYGENTADVQITSDLLPESLSADIQAIHFGSLAMIRQPIGSSLTLLMEREYGKRLISLDPNIRPDQIEDRDDYLAKLRHWLSLADLVKASTSDIDYLYPEMSPDAVAKNWLSLGPRLIVITDGPHGATACNRSARVEVSGGSVDLVDSVGAGDAFTAGLLAWLCKSEHLDRKCLPDLSRAELRAALTYATRVAAITCTRLGADPPWESELLIP